MTGTYRVPLQITLRDVPRVDVFDADIERRTAKFTTFHPHITGVRVTLDRASARQRRHGGFRAHVEVRTAGPHVLVVVRERDADLAAAMHDAFDAMDRRLEDLAREARGAVKAHPPRASVA